MSSREAILAAVKENRPPATQLPSLDQDWITFENKTEHFLEMLTAVGGRGEVIAAGDVNTRIGQIVEELQSREICSLEPNFEGNLELESIESPKQLETLDLAIIPCPFGVAENAAIWLTAGILKERAVLFIAQHLIFTLPESEILHNMHEAYARLSLGEPEFGVFVSGPSKTADIEQSLVIGAHGARSLTVLVTRD